MNPGSPGSSGSSSISVSGSSAPAPGPGVVGVPVDDPSPLTSGSSTLPAGGTGFTTGGGGSGAVGEGTVPVVDLPSSTPATIAPPCGAEPPAFDPEVTNTSFAPLALMRGSRLGPGRLPPPGATLNRRVVPLKRSRRKTSLSPLVSSGTRLVAVEPN